MTTWAQPLHSPAGWLRGTRFDRFFILGIAGIALGTGLVITHEPWLFAPVLFADVWLLGYHHVVSTFTRLCFDARSFRDNRFLILGLPVLVVLGMLTLVGALGLWTITTAYLYWQWFHYTRQSWGVAQVYRRKAGGLVDEGPRSNTLVFYFLPLWGILKRSHQDPDTFLGIELWVVPVPEIMVTIVGMCAVGSVLWWTARRIQAWRQGRLAVAHTQNMLSHFAVFYVGYVLIDNIDMGWLVLNIWHNLQYIAFVWFYNTNRFKRGIDPDARFLSMLSQDRNLWIYLAVCAGLSSTAYWVIGSLTAALVAPVIIFQAINFHHYIVDGLIWKVRHKTTRQTLGIAS